MYRHIKPILTLIALVSTGWFVYQNGLSGGFIFDDENNISRLQTIDNDITFDNLKNYFGQSTSGPLKRPISVFSFLIDAQDWPADAYSFKRTNLIIHLLNGSLLFLVLLVLFKIKGYSENKRLYTAGISTGLWLLHPFLVSTTLYVVQRMAMLPLTFMLIGFLLYLRGRTRYELSQGENGKVMLFIAVYAMTVLAMLSKENGVIFLWLIALFELYIVKRYLLYMPINKKLSLWLLKLPGWCLVLLLLIQIPSFINDYDLRIFNMSERLLTEVRAVSKYLYHLFLPNYFTEGVFTDGFVYSKGLMNPITTLYSLLFVIALIGTAWIKRKTWIWFSFVVFFFFLAQFLESTIVPLELYFEHRVYVASIFLFVPVTLVFVKLSSQSKIYLLIPLLFCIVLGAFTFMRSDIWGNNLQLHQLTMDKYPESIRGKMMTAKLYDSMGMHGDVRNIINQGAKDYDNLQIKFNQVALQCNSGELKAEDIDILITQLESNLFIKNDHRPFINMIEVMFKYRCLNDSTLETIYHLADAVENNPNEKLKAKNAASLFIKARVFLEQGNYEKATDYFLQSLEISKKDYHSMHFAIVNLINKSQYKYAQIILNYERRVYYDDFKYKIDWLNIGGNIEGFQELIDKKLNENGTVNHNSG
ncbi:MAG: tetratricopeptide repeat-containing protein [Proteobacteria bacterium]|nr:MAG: tetratricopeptide repeat-containing protein [Pseudomonadota bacterium]